MSEKFRWDSKVSNFQEVFKHLIWYSKKKYRGRAEDLINQYPQMQVVLGKYHNFQPILEELSNWAGEFRSFQSNSGTGARG